MELQANTKAIRRIILLKRDQSGILVPETLWTAKKKKNRTSSKLRGVDRVVSASAKAQKSFGENLLKRHQRSNRKRKNGGLRDLGANLLQASRKASTASK